MQPAVFQRAVAVTRRRVQVVVTTTTGTRTMRTITDPEREALHLALEVLAMLLRVEVLMPKHQPFSPDPEERLAWVERALAPLAMCMPEFQRLRALLNRDRTHPDLRGRARLEADLWRKARRLAALARTMPPAS